MEEHNKKTQLTFYPPSDEKLIAAFAFPSLSVRIEGKGDGFLPVTHCINPMIDVAFGQSERRNVNSRLRLDCAEYDLACPLTVTIFSRRTGAYEELLVASAV
ncbi:Hypothetical predicted protein [Scomber scombrus]|uniref:Uncharacterized protein n=1 Tax=Scomber scombrus TaxID=13677 RepID=A0AAV1N6F1_SCOSC